MKPINLNLGAVKKYQIICLGLFLGIIGLFLLNVIYSSLAITKINAAKQQALSENLSRQATQDLNDFFTGQTATINAINQALPSQNELVNLVEKIESLKLDEKSSFTFGFSSLVPMVENNQYFLPFNLRLNTTLIEAIDFFRRFEKLPYLTKVGNLSVKTPQGLSGLLEINLSGRIYVQDNFKN